VNDSATVLALVRLHDVVSVARKAGEALARELEPYTATAVHLGGPVEADIGQQERIGRAIEALVDAAELAHLLSEPLLRREPRSLYVEADELIAAAADWLRHGIADARQLRLAASLLSAREGLPALADALSSTEHPWTSEATIRDVLGSFWRFPAALVDAIGAEAGVDVDTRLEDVAEEPARKLIAALRDSADRPEITDER
jgi:hypothetical protein